MKNIILINLFILFFLNISPSFAGFPNIPKHLDKKYCEKKGGKFGHVIVVIDKTTTLDTARIDFIKDQVFSEEFYLNYAPHTKFSYFLIDHNEPQTQKFLFSKCRVRTGDKNFSKLEKATIFENAKVLKAYSGKFFSDANDLHNDIFSETKESKYSYIYETIAYIFQNPKSDFNENQPKRDLVIVSDLMQNTDRLSFYIACNANSDNAKCPTFQDFMNNNSDKDYILSTSPKGDNISAQIIYLNNRCETHKALDKSLKELWENYFKSINFNLLPTIHQTDINAKVSCS